MKYIVMDEPKTEISGWTGLAEEFDDPKAAINRAEYLWNHLTDRERKTRNMYVLESVNPDEEADDHFDGNPIWENGVEQEEAEMYRHLDTGETYTLEEIRRDYEMFKDELEEKYDSFEEYFDHLLDLGRQGIAGFVEI